jgi:nucleoside-diphosphate-sugar epimerase
MTVLVMGSSGYLGRHLVANLSAAGLDVAKASSATKFGIEPKSGLLPVDFLIPKGTETIVYLSQSPRYRELPSSADHVLSVNALSPVRLALLAKSVGVKRFIYLSTGTVYEPCFNSIDESAPIRRDGWYALSKIHAEEGLSLFRDDIEVIVIRLFGVYGPGQTDRLVPNIANSILTGRVIKLHPHGNEGADTSGLHISLCYVDDAVDCLRYLVLNGGPSFLNLASPTATSVRDVAELIGQNLGIQPHFEIDPSRRDTDLIANTSLLNSIYPRSYISLQDGIKRTLAWKAK